MTDYPDTPGYYAGAPETSRDAAEQIAKEALVREAAALKLIESLAGYGATADEVAERLGWEERYSSRPRLSMLRARGAIEDSGRRRRGVSGRQQAVWVLPRFITHEGGAPGKAGEA
jgi:hypothetical protein